MMNNAIKIKYAIGINLKCGWKKIIIYVRDNS